MQPGRVLFGLLFVSVLVGLVGLVSSIILTTFAPQEYLIEYRVLASYARVALYAVAGVTWLRITRRGPGAVFRQESIHPRASRQVLAVLMGAAGIIGVHFLWTMLLPATEGNSTDRGAIMNALSATPVLLALQAFDYAIITPICEEIFFRRIWLFGMLSMLLTSASSSQHKRAWIVFSVVFTSVAFASIHGEPSRLVPLTVAGMILGFQAVWSRHIGLSIATHIVVNLIATAALML